MRRRTVGAFTQDLGTKLRGILGGDDVLVRGGQQDIGFQKHRLLAVHVLAVRKVGNGTGVFAVLHQRGYVEALRIVNGAVEFDNADDLEPGAGH